MKNQIFTLVLAAVLSLGFVLGIVPSANVATSQNPQNVSSANESPAEDRLSVPPTTQKAISEKQTLSGTADGTSVETSGADPDTDADSGSDTNADLVPLPVFPEGAVPLATYINGRRLPAGASALIAGNGKNGEDKTVPYVSLGVFAAALGHDADGIVCAGGDSYIVSGDRCVPCSLDDLGVTVLDMGGLCVPASALASAAGLSVVCDDDGDLIFFGVPSFPSADDVYAEEDLYWLSRIISAESRGEPFEGQLAVGCVVLNRTRCKSYPDTVKDVVFDNKFGIQFTPAYTGSVNNPPTESCVIAAKLCLEGFSLSDSILFFFNSSIAAGSWITSNRTYAMTVGRHDFYS